MDIFKVAKSTYLKKKCSFKENLVEKLFPELSNPDSLLILESTGYFERYLWSHFKSEVSTKHLLSLVILLNEKIRLELNVLDYLTDEDKLPRLFTQVLTHQTETRDHHLLTLCVKFLNNLLLFIDVTVVRKLVFSVINVDMFAHVLPKNRDLFLRENPQFSRSYTVVVERTKDQVNSQILPNLVKCFLENLVACGANTDNKDDSEHRNRVLFLETCMEFFCDLVSAFATRKFVVHILRSCEILKFVERHERNVSEPFFYFKKLFVYFYEFPILDSEVMTRTEVAEETQRVFGRFRKLCFKSFDGKLQDLAIVNQRKLFSSDFLTSWLQKLSVSELNELSSDMSFANFTAENEGKESLVAGVVLNMRQNEYESEREFVEDCVVFLNTRLFRTLQNNMTLTKTNLQFYTLCDYIMRCFISFRRNVFLQDQEFVRYNLSYIAPKFVASTSKMIDEGEEDDDADEIVCKRNSEHCMLIREFKMTDVGKTNVQGTITLRLHNVPLYIRSEWENLRTGDVLYLIRLKQSEDGDMSVETVRGCTVKNIIDEDGNISSSFVRSFSYDTKIVVEFDLRQFEIDVGTEENEYEIFHVVLKKTDSNSTNLLRIMKKIMQQKDKYEVDEWLEEMFLGNSMDYDRPRMSSETVVLNEDLVEDYETLEKVLRQLDMTILSQCSTQTPPFELYFQQKDEDEDEDDEDEDDEDEEQLVMIKNAVVVGKKETLLRGFQFTHEQLSGVIAGIRSGITLISGSASTGKTEVVSSIIHHLVDNFPGEKTLVVTKTEFALDALVDKLQDIQHDRVMRLSSGGGDGDAMNSPNRIIEIITKRVGALLKEIREIIEAKGNVNMGVYSCETAISFYISKVEPILTRVLDFDDDDENFEFNIEKYWVLLKYHKEKEITKLQQAKEHCIEIREMFKQISELRFIELVRNRNDREKYLLTKHSSVVCMTYSELMNNPTILLSKGEGVAFDNLIFEEASRMFDLEISLPLILSQKDENISSKRIILTGDLDENVLNIRTKFFKQSLLQRFARLGVPVVNLTTQFRVNPKISALLCVDNITDDEKDDWSDVHDSVQFVHVGEYKKVGEYRPFPSTNWIQNLGEAEYVVQMFIYLRLHCDVAQDEIAILTTTEGQKKLIQEVINRRCRSNPVLGVPEYGVSRFDEYDGRRVNYVLVSLVRTKMVHESIRSMDVFKFVFSRAIRGLYVFFNKELFTKRFPDFTETFDIDARNKFFLNVKVKRRKTKMKNLVDMAVKVKKMLDEKMDSVKSLQEEFLSSLVQEDNEEQQTKE